MSNDQQSDEEILENIYAHAAELKKAGKSDFEIEQALIDLGLDRDAAKAVNQNLNVAIQQNAEDESGGFPRWIIYLLILGGINVLSAIFDWPFWIY